MSQVIRVLLLLTLFILSGCSTLQHSTTEGLIELINTASEAQKRWRTPEHSALERIRFMSHKSAKVVLPEGTLTIDFRPETRGAPIALDSNGKGFVSMYLRYKVDAYTEKSPQKICIHSEFSTDPRVKDAGVLHVRESNKTFAIGPPTSLSLHWIAPSLWQGYCLVLEPRQERGFGIWVKDGPPGGSAELVSLLLALIKNE